MGHAPQSQDGEEEEEEEEEDAMKEGTPKQHQDAVYVKPCAKCKSSRKVHIVFFRYFFIRIPQGLRQA
jgi:hypothetical protein